MVSWIKLYNNPLAAHARWPPEMVTNGWANRFADIPADKAEDLPDSFYVARA